MVAQLEDGVEELQGYCEVCGGTFTERELVEIKAVAGIISPKLAGMIY